MFEFNLAIELARGNRNNGMGSTGVRGQGNTIVSDGGSIAGGEDKRALPGNNPSGETTNTLDEEDRILYRTSDEI